MPDQAPTQTRREPMQLVRITHYRCGDYDCASFMLAPSDWSRSEINRHINKAMDDYLAAVDEAAKGVDKLAYPHPPQISAKDLDPTMTIAEARADFEVRKAAYAETESKRQYTERSFENFLADEGFVSLWSDDANAVEAEALWGHRHGQRLQYGNAKDLERWPAPRKLHKLLTGEAASDYDDEDFA